jgi:hypothetical protein
MLGQQLDLPGPEDRQGCRGVTRINSGEPIGTILVIRRMSLMGDALSLLVGAAET